MLLLLGPLVATVLLLVSTPLVLPFVLRILWRIAPIVFLTERRPYRHGGKCRGEGNAKQGMCDGCKSVGGMYTRRFHLSSVSRLAEDQE
jgi:hypothetical protein